MNDDYNDNMMHAIFHPVNKLTVSDQVKTHC